MQFRENALAKLEAPEDLDIPVRLTSPRAWLAVLAVGLLMAGGLLWAYAGSLPRTTTAAGVLMFPGGGFPLQSTVSGMVQRVFVEPGRFIEVGAPVAAVAVDRHVETVRAGAAGWVSEVVVQPGSAVTTGSTLALAERSGSGSAPLVAVLFVPASNAGQVKVGSRVDLNVRTAPSAIFGTVRGTVRSVTPAPVTRIQVTGFLGDETLATRFTANGPTIEVLAGLSAGSTPSGYRWSKGNGPPFKVASRTLVEATVHLPPGRPMDLVVPS